MFKNIQSFFNLIDEMCLMKKKQVIYSKFLILDKDHKEQYHITYDFNYSKSTLPCREYQKVTIKVVGTYEDEDLKTDIVHIILPNGKVLTKQNNRDRLLHITKELKEGVKAQESGIRATERGYTEIEPYILTKDAFGIFFEV